MWLQEDPWVSPFQYLLLTPSMALSSTTFTPLLYSLTLFYITFLSKVEKIIYIYYFFRVCIFPALDYSNDQRVYQYYNYYNLTAGTMTFSSLPLSVPSSTPAGEYKVTIGVYSVSPSASWNGLAWVDPVLIFNCHFFSYLFAKKKN
jgi:hypothetical protein